MAVRAESRHASDPAEHGLTRRRGTPGPKRHDPIREAKGFIFDMDGTLLSVHVDWAAVRTKLAEESGRTDFQPVFENLRKVIARRPELKARLFRTLEEYELNGERNARLHDGSKDVVELLSRRAPLALVTLQGGRVRDSLLERFTLAGHFKVLLSREDSLDRAEQLKLAVRGLALERKDVVFVGDRLHDLNCAAKVGVRFVMIRTREDAEAKTSFRDMAAFRRYLRRSHTDES